MRFARIAVAASPYAATAGTVLLVGMMLTTMTLTSFERQWTVFLCGVLSAAVFASVSHSASSRWVIARRTAQLKITREKLATESRLRAGAEQMLARLNTGIQFVDNAMPAMLAYVDAAAVVRYHNQSYARWIGLEDRAIDGRTVVEILGATTYGEVDRYLREALQGHEVRYERTQTMRDGEVFRLFVQYLPHFSEDGKVAGVFCILTDITRAKDLAAEPASDIAGIPSSVAERIIAALERDEFSLYSQSIASLGAAGEDDSFCEVQLRLKEEEEYHLPPGSFLFVAEEHGLLPHLDRWVARHVLDAALAAGRGKHSVYIVNVSPQAVAEGTFAQFIRDELATRKLDGQLLCLEFAESDVMANPRAYRDLISELGWNGCRFAVSGFGRNPASLHFLKQLRVNYLKLDGGIVLNLLREPGGLARVKAMNQAAHGAGMFIVAECVENESTRAALQGIETDFAQGFGISVPMPMTLAERREKAAA